jgi:signal transduction histidine kinase
MSEQTEGGAPWSGEDRRRSSWTTDWQSTVERDKAALARSLHDHSGGLLAAAIMDVTWSEMHLPPEATAVRSKLQRARAALDVAIDLNRRMIEELRPTLLDNFGLVAALKWHFTGACKAAGIECHQQYPDPSPRLSARSAIALYRIAQTVLALMVGHQSQQVDVALVVSGGCISLQLESSRTPHDFTPDDETTIDALSSVSSRIRSLGGSMALQRPPGGVAFKFELPAGASV